PERGRRAKEIVVSLPSLEAAGYQDDGRLLAGAELAAHAVACLRWCGDRRNRRIDDFAAHAVEPRANRVGRVAAVADDEVRLPPQGAALRPVRAAGGIVRPEHLARRTDGGRSERERPGRMPDDSVVAALGHQSPQTTTRAPDRERSAEPYAAEAVSRRAGFVESRREPARERQRELVLRGGRNVPRDLLEDPLDAAVQVAGGDVQHAHQRIRRPTTMVSPGRTGID